MHVDNLFQSFDGFGAVSSSNTPAAPVKFSDCYIYYVAQRPNVTPAQANPLFQSGEAKKVNASSYRGRSIDEIAILSIDNLSGFSGIASAL